VRRWLSGKLLARLGLGAVGLVVGILAVATLREATLSTHGEPIASDSQIELVVDASVNHNEPDQTIGEMVEDQAQACRLEVSSDMVGEIEPRGDGRFRAVLRPSMDETNRRQFRGCVEDWLIDGVRLNVVALEPLS
jgi:hypothetical protein